MRTRTLLAALMSALLVCIPASSLAQAPAGPPPARNMEEQVLAEAMGALGWPDTIASRRLLQDALDEDTIWAIWPPGPATTLLLRTKASGNNGGSEEDDTLQNMAIIPVGQTGGSRYVQGLVSNGFRQSTYQGQPAARLTAGEEICNARGLMGELNKALNQAFSELFFGLWTPDECMTTSTGYVAWTCGSHVFIVRDGTGQGAEERIAGALYTAAQNRGLCGLSNTLVILAGTQDLPGTTPITTFQARADEVNAYYEANAYGKVFLTYTFMDADGASGNNDWYTLSATMADYAGNEPGYAEEAIRVAFEHGAPREELEYDRVIVVYSGSAAQDAPTGATPPVLSSLAVWPPDYGWHTITVGPDGAQSTILTRALVMVSEFELVGGWAHEIGHTLRSRYIVDGRSTWVDDRYNYANPWLQFGQIGPWGLMGSGDRWGTPVASAPTHMCAYTKDSAGWLTNRMAQLGDRYTLTALENPGTAGALKIDDPQSANPEFYFLLEARQSGIPNGAPETGVALYQVTYNSAADHHVVNIIHGQTPPFAALGPDGELYTRPALRGAGAVGGVTVYRSPARRLEYTLHSESTDNGYSAVVSANVYTPTNLLGAVVAPAPAPAAPTAPPTVTRNKTGPLPDIDLHAWDEQGRHVGLNYSSGEWENQIPGAFASGDLRGAEEWIYVPEGTQVRYAVSAEKTRQFLEANPEWADEARPQEFIISYSRFDAQGVQTVADGGEGVVPAGVDSPLSSPYDLALEWEPAPAWHYGRNWPANLLLFGFMAGILLTGAIGGIVALVRR